VGTHDGVPNNPPQGVLTGSPPINDFAGNWVSIRMAPRRYLLYAHMVPGLGAGAPGPAGAARPGARAAGQQREHEHAAPALPGQRPPGVRARRQPALRVQPFTFLGQITDEFTDENLALRPTGELAFAPSGAPRLRRQEMPLDRNVVRFR
jgi:hypothetical protein